jgi:pyruvate dehydrogenase E2 component (dihydrolipoamide acetyltransferase)
MPEIVMPRLSDSMEEGTIVRWLKQDGDEVSKGEPLAEVETDKATVMFDADADGTLRILAGEGETVAIGGVIGSIGDALPRSPAPAQPRPAAPARAAAGKPSDAGNGSDRVKASPLARRIARESEVDLRGLSGSGPGGRIVKADVPKRGAKGVVTTEQPSRIQVQIAQRMAESKATIPDFTLHAEVAMEQAVELRTQLRNAARGGDVIPSYNDMVVKACGLALREHPRANAAYRDGAFELYERVSVGIAVAAHDSLVVPTVFDADRMSLLEIAQETRRLVERVRSHQITPAELSGGTFTVSNLGMYGVASFEAIINPPQAAILAVGELREVPVVREGQVAAGSRMSIALTCDHRILYGAPAAEFLARVRRLLEQPLYLLV